MKLLKSKQPQKVPDLTSGTLAERIKETCAAAEQYVAELKASPEGQSLPLDWIKQNIYATARAKGCHCRCALSLLEKENG